MSLNKDGSTRKTYVRRTPFPTEAHLAAMTRKRSEPDVVCGDCKKTMRPSGLSRHVKICGIPCVIADCGGQRVSMGLCGNHKTMMQTARKYGVTTEQYIALHVTQNGKCKACGTAPKRALCLDHDHATGKPRGLLCHNCNVALGLLRDDPARLRALADYLEATRG